MTERNFWCAIRPLILTVCLIVAYFSCPTFGQVMAQGQTSSNSGARGLDTGWATLAEATSEIYYWDHVPSEGTRYRAMSRLSYLKNGKNVQQQRTASDILDIFGRLEFVTSEREHSGLDPQSNQKRADELSLEGLSDPDNADQAYYSMVLGPSLKTADIYARADVKVKQQEEALRKLWGEQILPACRVAAGPDTAGKPVEVQIGVDDLYLWMRATNTSNQTLHNCTLILNFGLGTAGPLYPPMEVFIPEWPAGKSLFAPFFESQLHLVGTDRRGGTPRMRAGYELWSDELHTPSQAPTVGNGWKMRYEFFTWLFRPGARYGCNVNGLPTIIDFNRLDRGAQGCSLTAVVRLLRTSGRSATAETFTGEWLVDPPRNLFTMSNAKTISFQLNSLTRAVPTASRGFAPSQPRAKSLSAKWYAGRLHVTIGSSSIDEQKLEMVALPRRRSLGDGGSSGEPQHSTDGTGQEDTSQPTGRQNGRSLTHNDSVDGRNQPNVDGRSIFPSDVNKPDTYYIFIGDTPEDTLAADGTSYVAKVCKAPLHLNAKYFPSKSESEIRAYINHLPRLSRVNLIGHSYGGGTAAAIALDFTSHWSDRTLNALVTVDPASDTHPRYPDIQRTVPFWVNILADADDSNVNDKRWGPGVQPYARVKVNASGLHHMDFSAMLKYKFKDDFGKQTSVLDILWSR